MLKIFQLLALYFCITPCYAYLGPGMGAGIIFATIGFFVALVAAIFGIAGSLLKGS